MAFAAGQAQTVTIPLLKVWQLTGGDAAQHSIPHGFGKTPVVVWLQPLGAATATLSHATDGTNVYVTVSNGGSCNLFVSPETN
jgi:hypothetical protein